MESTQKHYPIRNCPISELIFVILIMCNKFSHFINCFSLIISFFIHVKNGQKNKLEIKQLSVHFQYSCASVILYSHADFGSLKKKHNIKKHGLLTPKRYEIYSKRFAFNINIRCKLMK